MPKITTIQIPINIDGHREHHSADVYYHEGTFYCILPEKFNTAYDHLAVKDKEKYHVKYYSTRKYVEGDRNKKRATFSTTEDGAVGAMSKLINYLFKMVVKKRRVILFGYDNGRWGNKEREEEFEEIKMELKIRFAEETSAGGKATYSESYVYSGWNNEKETMYREINVDEKDVVVDDTPENREFLQSIYRAFSALITKMDEFTETPQKLLELIKSKQKLLS